MEQRYASICRYANGHMLLRVLNMLTVWVNELRDKDVESRVSQLRKDYNLILDPFLVGKDSGTQDILNGLVRQAWVLIDEIYLKMRMKEKSSLEYIEMLRPFPAPTTPQDAFQYFWLKAIDENDCAQLKSLIADESMEDEALMGLSGLMLNVIRSFSLPGILCLVEAAGEQYAECIRERAWVGLILCLWVHDLHLNSFPEIQEAIVDLTSTEDGRVFATTMMSCMLRYGGQDWVDDTYGKVQADIIPIASKLAKNTNVININELDMLDDQISSEVRDSIKLHQQEMQRMQEVRMDVNFTMFKDMYRTPFFKDPYSWWLPYAPDYLPEKMRDGERFLRMLPREDMCDSDKYAFISSMSQLNTINGVEADKMDIPEEQVPSQYGERLLVNDYLRQAYRFFALNPWQISSPFALIHTFPNSTIFQWLAPSVSEKTIMAEHCVRFHAWKTAAELCSATLVTKETAALLTMNGYACQQMGEYERAVNCYQRALVMEDNMRTQRRLAACFLKMCDYDEALPILERLLAQDADNKVYLIEKAACLEKMELYSEALDILYKLDLYYPKWSRVERLIMQCAMMIGDFESSESYFQKLHDAGQVTADDLIRHGSVLFAMGQRVAAVHAYQEARTKVDDFKDFLAVYRQQRHFLIENGITKGAIYMMEDLIIALTHNEYK